MARRFGSARKRCAKRLFPHDVLEGRLLPPQFRHLVFLGWSRRSCRGRRRWPHGRVRSIRNRSHLGLRRRPTRRCPAGCRVERRSAGGGIAAFRPASLPHRECSEGHDIAGPRRVGEFTGDSSGRPCGPPSELCLWASRRDLATPSCHPFRSAFGAHVVARRLEPSHARFLLEFFKTRPWLGRHCAHVPTSKSPHLRRSCVGTN